MGRKLHDWQTRWLSHRPQGQQASNEPLIRTESAGSSLIALCRVTHLLADLGFLLGITTHYVMRYAQKLLPTAQAKLGREMNIQNRSHHNPDR